MRARKFIAAGTIATLALVAAACGDDDDDESSATTAASAETSPPETEPPETSAEDATIVAIAVDTPDLSTLVQAVQAAELVDTLQSEGPFTVFAPTNEAFAAIPADKLEAILADKELLTKILTYHVVSGSYPAQAVAELPGVDAGAKVPTVEGQELTITVSGDTVTVNDATVETADVNASNGVVHVIDKVLLPPDVTL